MSSSSTIRVIHVTTNVYDRSTAVQHYTQELLGGNYTPYLYRRRKRRRKGSAVVYNVCRIPKPQDAAFIAEQTARGAYRSITAPFVSDVPMSSLMVVVDNIMIPADAIVETIGGL